MDEPWFRRWFWFSFWPIRWQGVALIALTAALEYPVFLLAESAEPGTPLGWLAGIAGILIIFASLAIVVWKTERSYGC
jgi:hypothetical protein